MAEMNKAEEWSLAIGQGVIGGFGGACLIIAYRESLLNWKVAIVFGSMLILGLIPFQRIFKNKEYLKRKKMAKQ